MQVIRFIISIEIPDHTPKVFFCKNSIEFSSIQILQSIRIVSVCSGPISLFNTASLASFFYKVFISFLLLSFYKRTKRLLLSFSSASFYHNIFDERKTFGRSGWFRKVSNSQNKTLSWPHLPQGSVISFTENVDIAFTSIYLIRSFLLHSVATLVLYWEIFHIDANMFSLVNNSNCI